MVVTLTTDFADAGPFVGVMKAVLRRHAPGIEIADLTHGIGRCEPAEAGFWLSRCYRYFPAGSVHIAVVDPGVGTARAVLACDWDGHRFLAPDNGILPMVVGAHTPLYALSPDWLQSRGWPTPSATFHGRDIFAPLAAAFATGGARPQDIGPVCPQPVPAAAGAPRLVDGAAVGSVVAIDTWGNLVTNIDATLLASLSMPRVAIAGRELPLLTTYGEADAGALLALVNAFGVVEIACREGNAARMLGVRRGTPVTVRSAP